MLEVRNLVKKYGALHALNQVSVTIRDGEFFSLLGPSGCGKTTFLRILGGFEQLDSGEVLDDGQRIEDLPPHQRRFNTVFQRYALFPHLSVHENVAFGLRMKNVRDPELTDRVKEALSLVKMQDFGPRSIGTLSGGQQQRVALARSFVNKPKVLLLDEPLSALDLKLRQQMQVELLSLQRRLKHTFIFVTHDQEEALTLSDRIAVMNNGIIEQVGTPQEIYEYPKTPFVAQFIGSINTFECSIKEWSAQAVVASGAGRRAWAIKAGKDGLRPIPEIGVGVGAKILVRPEKMKILKSDPGPDQNMIEGSLKEILYQGPITQFFIEQKDPQQPPLVVTQPNSAMTARKNFHLGDRVFVAWLPEDCLLMEKGVSP